MKKETIRVYHAKKPNFGIGKDPKWPDAYIHVADVLCPEDDLDCAYSNTNHIEHEWWNNPNVTLVGEPRHRSTSVGDIIVTSSGAYRVAMMGFDRIG